MENQFSIYRGAYFTSISKEALLCCAQGLIAVKNGVIQWCLPLLARDVWLFGSRHDSSTNQANSSDFEILCADGIKVNLLSKKRTILPPILWSHPVPSAVSSTLDDQQRQQWLFLRQAAYERAKKLHGFQDKDVIDLESHQFLVPGFIDLHTHAPQFSYVGTGYDLPLLDWLNKYTFPREADFGKSSTFAKQVYHRTVQRLIKYGTTTASYFATLHLEATKELVQVIHALGQRALIGKVNLDRSGPQYYVEETKSSIEDTRQLLNYIKQWDLRQERLQCIITPRFVPTCTPILMKELSSLAQEHELPIQSHLSESLAECDWVANLHPECKNYTLVYDQFHLLTPKTIMAHSIHLSKEERQLLAQRKVTVAHCPNSNFSLQSGVMSVRKMWQDQVQVGLGTDVAGGYAPSMLDAIRSAMTASKVVAMASWKENEEVKDKRALTIPEVFYMATKAGAGVTNWSIGTLEAGQMFDCILVDLPSSGTADIYGHDGWEELFEKYIYCGDDRCHKNVFVGGKDLLSLDLSQLN